MCDNDCIRAIEGMHMRAILSHHKRENFKGRKGISTQNVLPACDFNICFMFMLPRTTGNTHDSRISVNAIHNLNINFPILALGKYYLMDSGFAHRLGYMVPYKSLDIRYHFQEFHTVSTGKCQIFRNTRERFNFYH